MNPEKNCHTSQIINDLPAERDYLGFDSYVNILKELILDPKTHSPLTLGIFGRWGTGKTTLMQMLQRSLDRSSLPAHTPRWKRFFLFMYYGMIDQRKPATVWFDAWRYNQEEHLWAAFLQSILNQVDREWGLLKKVRFRIALLRKRIHRRHLEEVVAKNLLRLLVVILPLLVSWQIAVRIHQDIIPALTWLTGGLLTIIIGARRFVIPLIDSIRKNININLDDFMKSSDFESHIAFLDQFHEHFKDIVDSLPVHTPTKLVICIDDLDRCNSENITQVLDSIKLFGDIPGCIYIIGLDHEVVYEALKIKYKEDKKTSFEYLEKIVQLPFYLPVLEEHEMREYVQKLNFQLPTERCDRLFCVGLVANPRLFKRTINSFSFLWRLASSKPELREVITPMRLAKIVVIQQRHPVLYNIFKENPDYLIKLEKFFRAQDNILTLAGLDGQNRQQNYFPKYLSEFYNLIRNSFNREETLDRLYGELGLPVIHAEIETKVKELALFVEKNKLHEKFIAACAKMGYKNITEQIFDGLAQTQNDELMNEKKKLPDKLYEFIDNPQLSRLLLFDELPENSTIDDACFAGLSNEAIQQYFTLTLTTSVPADLSLALGNQPASSSESVADLEKN